VQYGENVSAGTDAGTVTVVGKGNCAGTVTAAFSIAKANPKNALTADESASYTQEELSANARTKTGVKGFGNNLKIYYDGSPDLPTNAGEYTVSFSVDAGENYKSATGVELGTFTITPLSLVGANVALAQSEFVYNGVAFKPQITGVTSANGVAISPDCYAVEYGTNTNAGTDAGTVKLTGTGSCLGSITKKFTIGKAVGALPALSLQGRVGYAQEDIEFPGEQWSWVTPSTKPYTFADVGDLTLQASYLPIAEEKTNYDWTGIATTVSVPVQVTLIPDSAWIQVASITNQAAVFSVKAGVWQHLNWSSRATDFAPNFSLTVTPNADKTTYTVAIQGKGVYEKVSASAVVGSDGRLITPIVHNPAKSLNPENPDSDIYDIRGNRIIGTPTTPGIYILRQGSQTRKIVVR
jgi:hypothetical protein